MLLFLVPLPGRDRVREAVLDLAHAPAFALLTWWLIARWPRETSLERRSVAAWTLVVALGGLIELLQGRLGRQASWGDALDNALGASAAVAWAWRSRASSPRRRLALTSAAAVALALASTGSVLVLADVLVQRKEMPRLASFERRLELTRWTFYMSQGSRVRDHATEGAWALRVDLNAGDYPGAALAAPPRDWSGYAAVTFDLTVEDGPLDLWVKLYDAEHDFDFSDRYQTRVPLRAGTQRVRVALSDVAQARDGPPLDLRRVAMLELFALDLRAPRTIYLDDIRLSSE